MAERTPEEGKVCADCKEAKPRSEFHREIKAPDGLKLRCKPCHRAQQRAYRAARSQVQAEANRRWRQRTPASRRSGQFGGGARTQRSERLTTR
jgi:hypothetical protein